MKTLDKLKLLVVDEMPSAPIIAEALAIIDKVAEESYGAGRMSLAEEAAYDCRAAYEDGFNLGMKHVPSTYNNGCSDENR